MEIIFGRENVEKLRERYTILDLETVQVEPGKTMEVFCLIPGEKIGLADLPQLENWKQLHADFLKGYHNNHHAYPHLYDFGIMPKEDDFMARLIEKYFAIDGPQTQCGKLRIE